MDCTAYRFVILSTELGLISTRQFACCQSACHARRNMRDLETSFNPVSRPPCMSVPPTRSLDQALDLQFSFRSSHQSTKETTEKSSPHKNRISGWLDRHQPCRFTSKELDPVPCSALDREICVLEYLGKICRWGLAYPFHGPVQQRSANGQYSPGPGSQSAYRKNPEPKKFVYISSGPKLTPRS